MGWIEMQALEAPDAIQERRAVEIIVGLIVDKPRDLALQLVHGVVASHRRLA